MDSRNVNRKLGMIRNKKGTSVLTHSQLKLTGFEPHEIGFNNNPTWASR